MAISFGRKPHRIWPEWTEYGDDARTWYSGGFLHEIKGPERGRLTNECDHYHRTVRTALECATRRLTTTMVKGN